MLPVGSFCFVILSFLAFSVSLRTVFSADLGCSNVKYVYTSKGIDPTSVPREPVSGEHLQICQQGRTCCTEEMEQSFVDQSRQEFRRILNGTVVHLHSTLASRSQRFDEFFRELLKKSKKDFHDMFLKTYGMLYEQNSEVFTDLFQSLEKYYSWGQVSLSDALDGFFTTLYQKMFTVLNAQYTFDQKYLGCVSEFMEELQPFGDVPRKLSLQIKRAFVAARVFVWGLIVGREVVKTMLDFPFSPECNKALARMTYCPHCQGLLDVKPCSNYCLNVMKGCLAYYAELDDEWNQYIDALLMLADRLEGPFNIESVVDPIDIKISDAIMNFQESGPQVSEKVFQGCGQPRLGKRDVSGELSFDTFRFEKPSNAPRPTTAAGTSLDRLVKDIRSKIKGARAFWTQLPYHMCSHEQVAADFKKDQECWNGLAKAKYESQIMGDGVVNQAKNPEVNLDIYRQNSIINELVVSLTTVTDRLRNAYNGVDVALPEYADYIGSGSSSGSGDGASGFLPGSPEEGQTFSRSGVQNYPSNKPKGIVVEESDFEFSTTVTNLDIETPDPGLAGSASKMSLNRAISIVILPLLVAWFGSAF